MVELSLGSNAVLSRLNEVFNASDGYCRNILSVITRKIPGSQYTGWMDCKMSDLLKKDIVEHSEQIRDKFEKVVILGVGGSYLGSKASLDFLCKDGGPDISFCGYNLSPDTYIKLLGDVKKNRTALIVISKSGTTIEPSVSLRIFLSELSKDRGNSVHVTAITDSSRGVLKKMATENNWKTFSVPDDIGGRFSVITPVGLLPLAIAGADIEAFSESFRKGRDRYTNLEFARNPAMVYSFARFNLLMMGFLNELFVTWQERSNYLGLWWQQLFGECEGKDSKGIFPSTIHCTRDLHSLGQYIQDGRKELFETFFYVKNDFQFEVPVLEINDKLDYIAGKQLSWINEQAKNGTKSAHEKSGRPVLEITVEKSDENSLGDLFAFLMFSAAFSSQFLGVNAFNQPGVEAYKKEMLKLLENCL
ncbi:glucose-6-phosphate isomerase [candidate division WOR-3 bacterium]|nr:glucose-6-phosphate isomerase [candidate division WOR-3 bacterium]